MSLCRCTLSMIILGDGCQYCNPEEALKIEKENSYEMAKAYDRREEDLNSIELLSRMAFDKLEDEEYRSVQNKLRQIIKIACKHKQEV